MGMDPSIRDATSPEVAARPAKPTAGLGTPGRVGSGLHIRSSMGGDSGQFEARVRRRCLVCDDEEERWEPEETDVIGPECSGCHAPTERLAVLERHRLSTTVNPHAAALGRLGGLKGGPARAAKLSARRRREIARIAARARWTGSR